MGGIKLNLSKYRHDGLAVLTVTFWVFRCMAGVLAMNSEVYRVGFKHFNFTLSALVGFFVIGQVIYEIHTLVRSSLTDKA